jgi:hypothetical protein
MYSQGLPMLVRRMVTNDDKESDIGKRDSTRKEEEEDISTMSST